ncbi:MAG: protein-export chaperone SecB [Alphaproteobacteria bacterium]|nr:protein-export chaperone SecB [Alphaproteobacteria bacterium]MDE2336502.1 protein-export chaperone SecB [Alphaproteobacteria bacterium]
MADKKDPETTPAAGAQQQNMPGLQIIAQYVKDASFENPNAPESLVSGWPAPETEVKIAIGNRHIKDNIFESEVNFQVEAKHPKEKSKVAFIIDLHYGAMVALQNIPQENIHAVLMVEVPKLLFPFMREMIADMTSKGGYPPLYLAPVSFETMYIEQMKLLREKQDAQKAGNA